MPEVKKMMNQWIDAEGNKLHLSGELVIAKNKGETFAQHAADTTRHLTTAQVDTAIETALAPIQEELDQIAGGGTGGGDSLEVGDILLTANPARDVSSFLPADGSRIRAEPYPELGKFLGIKKEPIVETVPSFFSVSMVVPEPLYNFKARHRLYRNKDKIIATLMGSVTKNNFKNIYRTSSNGTKWEENTVPTVYNDICYLNNQWICIGGNGEIWISTDFDQWERKPNMPWMEDSSLNATFNMGYGNGIYFCIPSKEINKVYISNDNLETWTTKNISGIKEVPYISIYKDGYYIFFETVGLGSSNGKMHYSNDKCETWTTIDLPVPVSYESQVFENNGRLYFLSRGNILIFNEIPTYEVYPVSITNGSTNSVYTGQIFYTEGLFFIANSYKNYSSSDSSLFAVSKDGLSWKPITISFKIQGSTSTSRYFIRIVNMMNAENAIILSCLYNQQNFNGQSWTGTTVPALCFAPVNIDFINYLTLPNIICPGAKAYVKAL